MLSIRVRIIMKALTAVFVTSACIFVSNTAFAWTDQAHMAIARAAGLKSFHNACAPDVAKHMMKINNYRQTANKAHFFNATCIIAKEDVYNQLAMIEDHKGINDGYILGAVVQTVRRAKDITAAGGFDEYEYDILAHYIGDLVQPLHMSKYDEFNRKWHLKTDIILDDPNAKWDVDGAVSISKELKIDNKLEIKSEDELVNHLVILANESYTLAEKMRKDKSGLTREEALTRASRGASFLRAVMRYCGKNIVED